MKKSIPFACVLFTAAALHAAKPQVALDAAFVPGADYFGHGLQCDAPVVKKMNEIALKFAEEMGASKDPQFGLYKHTNAFQELMKAHGLSEENGVKSVFSVDFSKLFAILDDAINGKRNGAKPSFNDIRFVIAYLCKEPLADDALQKLVPAAITLFSDEDAPPIASVENFTHGGAKGVRVTLDLEDVEFSFPFEADMFKIRPLAAVLLGENKVVYVGFEDDVTAAVDRANVGQKSEMTPEAKALVAEKTAGRAFDDHVFALAFVMPETLRRGAAKLEEIAMAKGRLPPGMSPVFDALKNLRGFRVVGNLGETVECAVGFSLDTPARAENFRDFMEINALSLAKIGLYQVRGKNTPLSESLKAVAEETSVTVHAAVTADDYQAFLDFSKKFAGEETTRENNEVRDGWDW